MFSNLIHKIQNGDRVAIAKAISIVEDERDENNQIMSGIFPKTGNAYRIGITGPPGAGKSSITDKLVKRYRRLDKSVAVIGVDPSSPFTGGALLGDRIRMVEHHADEKVFIRSMASRGGQGGLANKTMEAGDIFDAAGYDIILFETVGVGQVELDVVQATDTVIVVLVPESGDDIQMMKAGLMEIANIFIINKADRPGANKLAVTLKNVLSVVPDQMDDMITSVIKTVAIKDEGIDDLIDAITMHTKHITETGLWMKNLDSRYKLQVKEHIQYRFGKEFWSKNLEKLNHETIKNREDRLPPFQLATELLNS
jgi:LAO/AO transport system kinase